MKLLKFFLQTNDLMTLCLFVELDLLFFLQFWNFLKK